MRPVCTRDSRTTDRCSTTIPGCRPRRGASGRDIPCVPTTGRSRPAGCSSSTPARGRSGNPSSRRGPTNPNRGSGSSTSCNRRGCSWHVGSTASRRSNTDRSRTRRRRSNRGRGNTRHRPPHPHRRRIPHPPTPRLLPGIPGGRWNRDASVRMPFPPHSRRKGPWRRKRTRRPGFRPSGARRPGSGRAPRQGQGV